jgi:hypothetical protein
MSAPRTFFLGFGLLLASAACHAGSGSPDTGPEGDSSAPDGPEAGPPPLPDGVCDAAPATLATLSGYYWDGLTLDDTYIYGAGTDGVQRVPRTGGAPESFIPASNTHGVVLAGTSVYFLAGSLSAPAAEYWVNDLFVAPVGGGTPTVLVSSIMSENLATDGDSLYWGCALTPFLVNLGNGGSLGLPAVFGKVALSGGTVTTLPVDPGEVVEQIVAGADAVYFSTMVYDAEDFPGEYRIRRIPKDFSSVTTIWTNNGTGVGSISSVGVDASSVYFVGISALPGADASPLYASTAAVFRMNLDGSGAGPLLPLPYPFISPSGPGQDPYSLAVGQNALYVAIGGVYVGTGEIATVGKGGGSLVELVSATAPSDLALRGGSVYYLDANAPTTAQPLTGGPTTVMTVCE